MTRRLVGALVAAAFAFGFLTGAAGTIVAHDNTPNRDLIATMTEHMAGFDMDTMMSGSMMSGPAASSMPGSQHELHHPAASQEVVR